MKFSESNEIFNDPLIKYLVGEDIKEVFFV